VTASPSSTASINGEHVADVVAYFWTKHGHGPTWSELGELMDWSYEEYNRIIPKLAEDDWLRFKRFPRSLHPGERNAQARARYKEFQAARKRARKAASRG
jgi:hypothetical protein